MSLADIYADLVRKGYKVLDDVPIEVREKTKEVLQKERTNQ